MVFRFAQPLLLLVLIGIAAVWVWQRRRAPEHWPKFPDIRLFNQLPNGWRIRFRHVPDVLQLAVLVLLTIALARPQSGRSQEVIRGQGIEIVLAVDISSSMNAMDFSTQNRLETAKGVINSFISGREFDRIGLVAFAQDAFQITPPTLDYSALERSVSSLRLATDMGLDDGTAIGEGIASAANMLRSTSSPSRIIILLTDGASNAGSIGPLTAAQAVATLGIQVYTIGMVEASLIAAAEVRAQPADVNVDEATLQQIATITDGRYFRATDLTSLEAIYTQIDTLERSDVERVETVRWQDQAGILLVSALLLLILEQLLRHVVFQTL